MYASNKIKHFELLLEQNGIELALKEHQKSWAKRSKKTQKTLVEDIAEELFNEFINANQKTSPKYDGLLSNIQFTSV